jgi:hypothetical protein
MQRRREASIQQPPRKYLLATVLFGIGLSVAFLASACGADTTARETMGGKDRNRGTSTTRANSQTPTPGSARFTETACGTYSGRGCAPTSERVDLDQPSFSNPTKITNPLFPISDLHSFVLLGQVDGKPFRSETTLLPDTKTVTWNGKKIETRVSQYAAFLDGRIEEVALDRYAQADDGSVWYLGEDVFDYRKGAVAITEGTWLAGREGPVAMIMPAEPKAGDVHRPENVLGVVFEEVRVKSVGETVDGPRGPVEGAIVSEELHLDGTYSDKTFAPGYGEFYSAHEGDVEALALAVPTDALDGPPPAELQSLSTSAVGILENARLEDWEAASSTVKMMITDWDTIRAGDVPKMLETQMREDLDALTKAVEARDSAGTSQAAIDVARANLDLQLRYRAPAEIDAARFELWTQQLRVDAAAEDLAGVTGDVAVLEWLRDRFAHKLGPVGQRELDTRLRDLRAAADAKNLPAAADHAARLGAQIRSLA